jgi:hypothetical protein
MRDQSKVADRMLPVLVLTFLALVLFFVGLGNHLDPQAHDIATVGRVG